MDNIVIKSRHMSAFMEDLRETMETLSHVASSLILPNELFASTRGSS